MSGIVAGAIIDGYELIRVIGQGGFGTVWVARSQLLGSYVALKVIAQQHGVGSQRELNAVQAYKKLAIGGLGSGLMPIEHVGLVGSQVFYVMPLSDGVEKGSPADANWTPLTLSARITRHTAKGTWFTSQEIASLFTDICKAAQTLSDAGLVHRDIKPDNILFFQGRAVVSDVSLVTDDAEQGTRYGTPGFSAPSWYVETGGKIDMFSIAAALFTVLTGQSPDKMGRAAFRWPPGGKDRLSESEQNEWARLHRVVLRATHEDAAERFVTFSALAAGLHQIMIIPRAEVVIKPPVEPVVKNVVESSFEQNGWGYRLGSCIKVLRRMFHPIPLIVLLVLFFLTSVLINVFVVREAEFYICCIISIVFWCVSFYGARSLRRDWSAGGDVLVKKLIAAVVISLVVLLYIHPFIRGGQTQIYRQDEGWLWWRHVREVAHVNEAGVEYITYSVLGFLFAPSYAVAPPVLKFAKMFRP